MNELFEILENGPSGENRELIPEMYSMPEIAINK